MPSPSGVGSENPWIPCLNGRFPVAIDVQSIGESGGCNVAMCAIDPCSTSLCTLGIFPASISGLITFQSAASQPMRRTFLLGFIESLRCGNSSAGDSPALEKHPRPQSIRAISGERSEVFFPNHDAPRGGVGPLFPP